MRSMLRASVAVGVKLSVIIKLLSLSLTNLNVEVVVVVRGMVSCATISRNLAVTNRSDMSLLVDYDDSVACSVRARCLLRIIPVTVDALRHWTIDWTVLR